ncbi:MAG: hemerythrin domain-containing protein [Nitrospinota bacterium]|jgi:hemerythrin-like metal-binding protein|nr:hemerythrin domain-containing protein [Nitrospinota bacterium]|tara:strand:- start:171 stop:584 length:414 start_codon:yes stop_codon:yes gene_type:complete
MIDTERFGENRIGIDEIDSQHVSVLEFYNSILESKEEKNDGEVMDTVIKLIEHWENHFKYEEDLMEKYGYSGLAEHKAKHEGILETVLDLKKADPKGHIEAISTLSFLLNLWIDQHIGNEGGEDKILGKFLQSKGLT